MNTAELLEQNIISYTQHDFESEFQEFPEKLEDLLFEENTNTYFPLYIGVPNPNNGEFLFERERFEIIPISVYRIGNEFRLTGWELGEQDARLEDIFRIDGFDESILLVDQNHIIHDDEYELGSEDAGPAEVQFSPLLPGHGMTAFLSVEDTFAYLNESPARIESSSGRDRLANILISEQYPKYLEQKENKSSWRHQPATLCAIASSIIESDEEAGYFGWVGSPTGSGKTRIQTEILKSGFQQQVGKQIYVTSRTLLVDQSKKVLKGQAPEMKITQFDGRNKETNGDVIITTYHSYEKLMKTLKNEGIEPAVVIFDEAHNLLERRTHLLKHTRDTDTISLGFTATPGIETSLTDIGMEEIIQVPLSYLIDIGTIPPITIQRCTLRLKEAENEFMDKYQREPYAEEKAQMELRQTVHTKVDLLFRKSVFLQKDGSYAMRSTFIEAANIMESKLIYDELSKKLSAIGISSDTVGRITSEQGLKSNSITIGAARQGRINILIGVDMISEGLDLPEYEVIILKPWKKSQYRPFQDMGRVMRRSPNGNSCLIVEIWPYEEADISGYRSALEVIGVKLGDGRVSFRNKKQYESATRALRRMDDLRDTREIQVSPTYIMSNVIHLRTPERKRNRSLVGVTEYEVIQRLIIPKYIQYLKQGNTPITVIKYYHNINNIRVMADVKKFKEIMGFSWYLLPFFRLSDQEIDELTRAMYGSEVAQGFRKPLRVIENPRKLVQYLQEMVTNGKLTAYSRENVIKKLTSDFGIASYEYTLNSLLRRGIEARAFGSDMRNWRHIGDRVSVNAVLHNSRLSYLSGIDTDLGLENSELLEQIEAAIDRRLDEIIDIAIQKFNGFRYDGSNFERELIYYLYEAELKELDRSIKHILKLSKSIRFGNRFLSSRKQGRRGVSLLSVRYRKLIETRGLSEDLYNIDPNLGVERVENILVERIQNRLKIHGLDTAKTIASALKGRGFENIMLVKRRQMETILSGIGLDISIWLIITRAAMKIDLQYKESHDLWLNNDPDVVAHNVADLLIERGLVFTPKNIGKQITSKKLLQLTCSDGTYVLPPIFTSIQMSDRSDGRTRMALRNYIKNILNIESKAFLECIRVAYLEKVSA